MIHLNVTAAARLVHKGMDMRLSERRGDQIDWVCDRTRGRLTVTDEELAELIAQGEARLTTGIRSASDLERVLDLDALTKAEKEIARRKIAYVDAVLREGLVERPPTHLLKIVIDRTAARIDDEAPPCTRTVKRWVAQAGSRPTVSRLADRTKLKGNRNPRIAPEVQPIVECLIDERFLKRPPISVATLTSLIEAEVVRENEQRSAENALIAPGPGAVTSAIAARDPRDVMAARYGEVAAAAKFDLVEKQIDPEAPLDVVEIDHTVADLYVVNSETGLPIGRPTIGMAIDRCTRMPFGIYIGFEPPSVLTVLQVLRNGILPKTYVDRRVAAGDWKIKNRWPVFGVPRSLKMDRAIENLGHDMRDVACEIGISRLEFMPRKKPQHKGAIERFFQTQNRRLLHEQRGTTYSNVLDRDDYDSARNAVIDLDDMYRLAHMFLIDVYAQGPHAGIGGDLPARRWNELTERFPVDPIEDVQQLTQTLRRSEKRIIGREGIRFENIFYSSEELAVIRRLPAFRKAAPDGNVRFRYDPADLGRIHVHLPHLDRYLEVPPSPAYRDYADGLSIWEHGNIKDYHRARYKGALDGPALALAKAALIEEMDKADRTRRKSSTAKRRARQEGLGRSSPAGDDMTTSPAGSTSSRRADAKTGAPPPAAPPPPEARPVMRNTRFGSAKVLTEVGNDDENYDPYANRGEVA